MISTSAKYIPVAVLLPLAPLAIWSHCRYQKREWPTVRGQIVDAELHRYLEYGNGQGTPPGNRIEMIAVAEYVVDGVRHRRRLSAQVLPDDGFKELAEVRASFVGSAVTLTYNPDDPSEGPPVQWGWWVAWLLTLACVACSFPILNFAVQRIWHRLDRTSIRPRVITGCEYRSGCEAET